MAREPTAVWALTRCTGMSTRPAPGSSDRASLSRVRTTRTIASTSRIVETTFADTRSLWRTRRRTVRIVHVLFRPPVRLPVPLLVELRCEQVDQRVHLAGAVAAQRGVEPETAEVLTGDGSVDGEAYVGAVVVRRAQGGASPGRDHRDRTHGEHDQHREEPGHGRFTSWLTSPRPPRPSGRQPPRRRR